MVLDSIDAGYRLPKPRSMPEAVYLNVVRPCWIYQDESKIKEKNGSTKSLSIFTGRATFAQIDDDLAAIIATGGYKSSCESVGATAAPCDQRTGHVVEQGPFGGEYLLRSEMDGDTGLYAMPNTEERSTDQYSRVLTGAPGASVAQTEASGEYLLRDDIDDTAGTAMYALTSTADASTEHDPREAVPSIECAVRGIDRSVSSVNDLNSSSVLQTDSTARTSVFKGTSSTVGLHSGAGTAAGSASDKHGTGASQLLDLGNGCGTIKTMHMSAAAVALQHQSARPVGDASKPCGFHKLVPDSGNPAINLASVHAAGYDIYVSPRPLQQQHRSGSQSVGRDDTNNQCLSTPAMVVTVNPTVSLSKSSSACSSKQSSLV
jgi:hypothetical protein